MKFRLPEEMKGAALSAIDKSSGKIAAALASIDFSVTPQFARASYRGVQRTIGKAQEKGKQDDPVESLFISRVRAFIQTEGAKKVRNVQETTKKRIAGAIDREISEGGSVRDIADRISVDQELAMINYRRAMVIAHTETIRASNWGSMMGAQTAGDAVGLKLDKVWISTMDAATRRIESGGSGRNPQFDHILMNDKTVGMADKFQVPMSPGGYEMLDYPGDPSGSPGDTISCRCTIGYATAGG